MFVILTNPSPKQLRSANIIFSKSTREERDAQILVKSLALPLPQPNIVPPSPAPTSRESPARGPALWPLPGYSAPFGGDSCVGRKQETHQRRKGYRTRKHQINFTVFYSHRVRAELFPRIMYYRPMSTSVQWLQNYRGCRRGVLRAKTTQTNGRC